MENKKQIVTLTDIKEYFRIENCSSIIALACIFALFGLLSFIAKAPTTKAIMVVLGLLSLGGICYCVHCIHRIQRNRYFRVRTDILISKIIQHYIALKKEGTYRLIFCQGHYDMYIMNSTGGLDGVWYDIYDMGSKTVYDTAFIGDSFTLVCVGKRIRLAFNNKFFDIQDDF